MNRTIDRKAFRGQKRQHLQRKCEVIKAKGTNRLENFITQHLFNCVRIDHIFELVITCQNSL